MKKRLIVAFTLTLVTSAYSVKAMSVRKDERNVSANNMIEEYIVDESTFADVADNSYQISYPIPEIIEDARDAQEINEEMASYFDKIVSEDDKALLTLLNMSEDEFLEYAKEDALREEEACKEPGVTKKLRDIYNTLIVPYQKRTLSQFRSFANYMKVKANQKGTSLYLNHTSNLHMIQKDYSY